MLLDADDFAALDDAQRLAILETLVIGLLADNKIGEAEVRRFDEIVFALPWGVPRNVLVSMIAGSRNRLVTLKTPAQFQDYLTELVQRIPGASLHDKVLFTMATIMYSDGVHQLEKNVLGMFVKAFGITRDRVEAIQAALRA